MSELTHTPFDTREPNINKPMDVLIHELRTTFAHSEKMGPTEFDKNLKGVIGNFVGRIRRVKSDLAHQKSQALRDYTAANDRIMADLAELQKVCPHINTEHHPDASGNNDSSDTCLDCGKDAKYLERE